MNGKDIEDRARLIVSDPTKVRWTAAEVALWITDACRYIALVRPDACSTNGVLTLVKGVKQTISTATPKGLRLLDVIGNEPDGQPISLVDREELEDARWFPCDALPNRPSRHSIAGFILDRHAGA